MPKQMSPYKHEPHQERPSSKASTSSSSIGSHHLGSWITSLFFRVPNFGVSRIDFAVRTMSTTGLPRRQIVTGSPLSAALISSGSLFLASATFTFIVSMIAILDSHVNERSGVERELSSERRPVSPEAIHLRTLVGNRNHHAHRP